MEKMDGGRKIGWIFNPCPSIQLGKWEKKKNFIRKMNIYTQTVYSLLNLAHSLSLEKKNQSLRTD